jgi:hypothetical protein
MSGANLAAQAPQRQDHSPHTLFAALSGSLRVPFWLLPDRLPLFRTSTLRLAVRTRGLEIGSCRTSLGGVRKGTASMHQLASPLEI